MKSVADWIRERTPEWTDEERYRSLSGVHTWLLPVCILGGFFVKNWAARIFFLAFQFATIVLELYFQDCPVTMIEREFSDQSKRDWLEYIFTKSGWDLTRGEKMATVIGINAGLFVAYLIVLLRESILWMVGVAGISVTALPVLAWFSRAHPLPEIASALPR